MNFPLCRILFPALLLCALISCRGVRPPQNFGDDDSRVPRDTMPLLIKTTSIDSVNTQHLRTDIWKIESNDYPQEIRLYARVFDSTGSFVTNMAMPYAPNNNYWTRIHETLKRRAVDIDSFSVREFGENDSIPYSIMLTVDYSGSMNGVLEEIHEGTEIFINLKKDYDRIGISTFNKDYLVKVPMQTSKTELLQRFRDTREAGFGMYSGMYNAIDSSVKILKDQPPGMPRVLVIFTDGEDNYSTARAGDIFKIAKEADVHIFSVGFGYTNDTTLQNLAHYTGGRFYRAQTKDQLIAIFKDIYRSLRSFYLVSYRPPIYDGKHEVRLAVKAPRRDDTLFANGQYDASSLTPFTLEGSAFTKAILFDFKMATIKLESMPIIEQIADQLLQYPRIRLEIQGHTDNIGQEATNQKLSEARAQAVVDALVARGIEEKRLRPRGFGFSQPIAPNDTEENRQKNRRTEFKIIAK
ncbi:MAG TPA: OmpA family protein [Patescibacteria group bacterium]|nr:OmpA family protein [Patescibacteria group bacterium]